MRDMNERQAGETGETGKTIETERQTDTHDRERIREDSQCKLTTTFWAFWSALALRVDARTVESGEDWGCPVQPRQGVRITVRLRATSEDRKAQPSTA